MQTPRIVFVGIAGVILSAPTTVAQEKQQKKPVKAVRVMRLAGGGMVAAPTQDELKKRHADKLVQPWVKNADWITDFDKARATANESGKQIFAYFTRSYSP